MNANYYVDGTQTYKIGNSGWDVIISSQQPVF